MKDELLDIACSRILDKTQMIIDNRNEGSHSAYLKLWKLVDQEDEKISEMFDNLKRSTALYKIAALVRNDLIDEERLKEFSEETQEKE